MASWEKVKSKGVYCPIDSSGKISFDYMRRYIATLKAERVATLKAYLQATGLSNTILNEGELAALDALRQNRLKWIEVPVCGKYGAFEVVNTHCILNSQVVPNSGTIPYVGAGESNNSILSYISFDKNYLEKGNSIMIGGKTLVITYQETDYFSNDSHNLALYYKYQNQSNKELLLFLVSSLYCSLKPKYHWGDSISKTKIKNDNLMLPITKEGIIDYEFINNIINAITKICIEEVLNSKDLEISTTQNLIKQEELNNSPVNNLLLAAEPFEIYNYTDFNTPINLRGDSPILVGYFKDRPQRDWIFKNNLFNLRMGDRKGSMEKYKDLFKQTKTLILYGSATIKDKVRIFKISNPRLLTGEEMQKLSYPDVDLKNSYEVFDIEEITETEINKDEIVNEVKKKLGQRKRKTIFITPKI